MIINSFLFVCLVQFDDYVLCEVYKNNRSDGGFKRSRDVEKIPVTTNVHATPEQRQIIQSIGLGGWYD